MNRMRSGLRSADWKTENWPTNKTLLPLLLQLLLVRSVFLLIPIPPQKKSLGPERGISNISHAHEQQEHSWLPPSKASRGHVCVVCSCWEFERHVVLTSEEAGYTWALTCRRQVTRCEQFEKILEIFFLFFYEWTKRLGTWITLFILFLWIEQQQKHVWRIQHSRQHKG